MDNPIREKSYLLALNVLRLCTGPMAHRLAPVRKQILNAATSVGANVEEAQSAESREDFAHKISVALKEAREASYWLRLCRDSGLVAQDSLREALSLADEVIRMGSRIVKSTKSPPAA